MQGILFSLIFAGYDTGTIKKYEGPCSCPEEVSLTSIIVLEK